MTKLSIKTFSKSFPEVVYHIAVYPYSKLSALINNDKEFPL